MTIVRELVTKLGFSFDRTNLDKFEKSIIGFKTKAVLSFGAIGAAVKKTLDFGIDFSNKILNTSSLAKFSKQTTEEVQALQNVFKKFDINEDVFQNFLGNLTLGIKEAHVGVDSEFRKLVTKSGHAVRLYIDNQLVTSRQAIDEIFNYIVKLNDESEKIRIVKNIFGVDLATADAIIQIADLTRSEFDSLVQKEKEAIGNLDEAVKSAREFKHQINELTLAWNEFSRKVGELAVPKITTALGNVNKSIETFKQEGAAKGLSDIGAHATDAFLYLFGQDQLSVLKRQLEADQIDFNRRLEDYKNQQANSNAHITSNNKFEFNVAPGTTEQQANMVSDQVKNTMNTFWDEKVREVINNNPQVE